MSREKRGLGRTPRWAAGDVIISGPALHRRQRCQPSSTRFWAEARGSPWFGESAYIIVCARVPQFRTGIKWAFINASSMALATLFRPCFPGPIRGTVTRKTPDAAGIYDADIPKAPYDGSPGGREVGTGAEAAGYEKTPLFQSGTAGFSWWLRPASIR